MAIYLPNLHILTCVPSLFSECSEDEPNKVSVMGLTQFKNLKTVYFDINLVLNGFESLTCFIRFEFTYRETVSNQYVVGRNVVLKVMPLNLLQENPEDPTPFMTFKCDRFIQFSICNLNKNNLIVFLQGVPQSIRSLEYHDLEYIFLS